MKITLFTASRIMTCLMLISTGAFAGADTKEFTATFHLSAKYRNVTCNNTLTTSGEISGTEINFGTFSSDAAEKTKSVELTLDCSNGTDLPDTVKVGFAASGNNTTVDDSQNNRLYPSNPDGNTQDNLYYDWVWGEKIGDTIKASGVNSGHTALHPKDKVDLKGGSAGDIYEVVSQDASSTVLTFPLKITRGVKHTDDLAAGYYMAAVRVTVTYE
ncbi:hypothetical protein H2549_004844 [Salmonella enterica subsp. enterica serovar Stanley]|nr:hypothetical protein [Salmonella enterica subsp. enterica serovar Stanley]